jgi:hypothetical protein
MAGLHFDLGQTALSAVMVCAILLGGCRQSEATPPPIDAAALRRAEMLDLATVRDKYPQGLCFGRSAAPGLSYRARNLSPGKRILLTFGFGGLSHWEKPARGEALVDPALEAELRRASTGVLLRLPAGLPLARAPVEDGCSQTYLLSAPTYAGRLAFFDRSLLCDLCGSGATLAMKYNGKEWRLVAIHGSWVS